MTGVDKIECKCDEILADALRLSVQLVPVRLERVEADPVLVGEAGEEGADELDGLHDQEDDPQHGVNLGDPCLPEGKVGSEVLGRNRKYLQRILSVVDIVIIFSPVS